jgi:hypothetical protein
MGETPLLVTGLLIHQQGEVVTLKFELELGKSVQVQMNPSVLHVMVALLNKLQGIAQWGVGFDTDEVTDPSNPIASAPPLMH